MTPEFGVNPTGFLLQNSFLLVFFWFVLKVVFVIGSAVDILCG